MADVEPQLVFDNAVEGLFVHGIGARVTSTLKQKLRAVGLDLDKRLQPAYERDKWVRILDLTVAEIFPDVSVDEAAREIGLAITRGYDETLVGKAQIALSKLIGPRRMLGRLSRNLRSSNNYVTTELFEKGPREFEIHAVGLDLSPYFIGGIVEAALQFCGVKEPFVRVKTSSGETAVLQVGWKE